MEILVHIEDVSLFIYSQVAVFLSPFLLSLYVAIKHILLLLPELSHIHCSRILNWTEKKKKGRNYKNFFQLCSQPSLGERQGKK